MPQSALILMSMAHPWPREHHAWRGGAGRAMSLSRASGPPPHRVFVAISTFGGLRVAHRRPQDGQHHRQPRRYHTPRPVAGLGREERTITASAVPHQPARRVVAHNPYQTLRSHPPASPATHFDPAPPSDPPAPSPRTAHRVPRARSVATSRPASCSAAPQPGSAPAAQAHYRGLAQRQAAALGMPRAPESMPPAAHPEGCCANLAAATLPARRPRAGRR